MTGFLTLSTAFTDINATDQLGRINFQAPLEAGGTDAILAGASIYGIAEATFANNNNSTGIAFATATSSVPIERMRIDSSGNVGIGRTPTQKLDIYASSGNQTIMNELGGGGNAELRLKNNAGDRIIRASADKLQFIDNADSRADLTIDGSGNVGIGIASPTSKLSVSAGRGANTGLEILDSADSNNKRIDLRLDADGDGYLSLVDASETTKVQLYSNGVSYFNGGNVGIGTTSPTAKLTVSGSMDDNIIKFGAVPAQNIAFGVTNDRDPTRVDFFLATEYGAESWSKRVTVTNQGNVGIGTTSPDYQLELEKAGGGFLSFKTTDTEIVNNDVLGTIQFGADDATASGIDIGAKIVATATDNF
jgi:hypothetical protein